MLKNTASVDFHIKQHQPWNHASPRVRIGELFLAVLFSLCQVLLLGRSGVGWDVVTATMHIIGCRVEVCVNYLFLTFAHVWLCYSVFGVILWSALKLWPMSSSEVELCNIFISLKLLRRRVSGALCDTCQYVPGIITEWGTPLYKYILAWIPKARSRSCMGKNRRTQQSHCSWVCQRHR
mgnify:CR=1 FL=1